MIRLISRNIVRGLLASALVGGGALAGCGGGDDPSTGDNGTGAGTGGTTGGSGGTAQAGGKSGSGGKSGAAGSAGHAGASGSSGHAGAGASGKGGSAGASGAAGAAGKGGAGGSAQGGKGGASGSAQGGKGGSAQGGSAGAGGTPAGTGGATGGTAGSAGAGVGGTAGSAGAGVGGATGGSAGDGGAGGTAGDTGAGGTAGAGGTDATGGTAGTGGTGIVSSANCDPPSGSLPALSLTKVATGITRPVLAKAAPGDSTRLYVVSKPGYIYVVKNGVQSATPFLDIHDLIDEDYTERGLIGLAFAPDFATSGRFYVHFSGLKNAPYPDASFVLGADGDTVLAEAHATDGDSASESTLKMVLTQSQPEKNHNGGSIEFSPLDGFLYMALGDGGGGDDQHGPIGNGQNTGTLLAKILRLDVSTLPYTTPPGNLSGAGVKTEIWDYGLRNPYRTSFDACTGDLYIGDVGQNTYEEVDIEPAGKGNRNYGWRVMEGTHCNPDINPPAGGCNPPDYTPPVLDYPHTSMRCAVTGGYVYRGTAIPALRGAYFYGDYCSGNIYSLRWNGTGISDQQDYTTMLSSGGHAISSFGQDNEGELYVVYYADGEVRKLTTP